MHRKYGKAVASFLVVCMMLWQTVPAFALSETDARVRDAAVGGARSELFNSDWKFYVSTVNANAQGVDYDDSKWADVELPHDWQIHQFGASATNNVSTMYANGYGWYRKTFYLPPEDEGKNITLRFDGVYMDVNVYINGQMLTLNPADTARTWAYGYTVFYLDITDYLHYGNTPNVVAVRCWFQNANSRWYSGAGIYRNVWMIKTDPVHVAPDGTYITTDGAGGHVTMDTEVVNTSASAVAGVTVAQTLYDPDGVQVASASTSIASIASGVTETVQQTLSVDNPALWDIEDPKQYTMKTTVTGGGAHDEYITKFGFRTILATPKDGFFLNGRRVTLQGVCMHHDLGALGAAVNYRAVERQLEIMQEMGVNAIRTAHNPPTPELLEICDRIGLMVVTESFDCWSSQKNTYDYARFFNNWSALDVRSWVRHDRNHPSVIMWSLGNEVGGAHTDSGAIARAARLHELVRASDPRKSAYTTYSTNAPEDASGRPMQIGGEVFDVFGYNYLDINIRGVNFTKWHDKYPDMPIFGGETSSAVRSRGIYMLPDTATFSTTGNMRNQASSYDNHIQSSANGIYTKTAADAHKSVRDYSFNMGEFVWTGFDYLGEPSPYGGTSSNTNAKNSYFGIVDTAGLPKDIYYFYQSIWTDKPVLHLLPYWAPVSTISYNGIDSQDGVPVWAYSNAHSVELF
ncbi:MAG: FxLYD domain-containing protein, partial [Oscillospiraceae bacterium]|nr:FxLYD domain-containing protein [Oscillospiraceae bacterium]